MVSGGHHGNRRHNDANEKTQWQLAETQQVVPDNARQGMTLVAA